MSAMAARKRKPFDPDAVVVSPAETSLFAEPGETAPVTVSQLTGMIRRAIERALPGEYDVVGEISNFKPYPSGHRYFTLKDADSELRCVMWRTAAGRLKFRPEDGMEVIATGKVDVYPRRGQYQLVVRRLEPRGTGALELAFRQLCEKLKAEGLFDDVHKKPLPTYPRRIAVVTSPSGAAIHDILRTIARRFPAVSVLFYPSKVQGNGAAEEVAAAVRQLNRHRDALGGIDLMIVGRGGGSLEDLWAFNEEAVARAIFASTIPVISAVGHESDLTVADLVADVRAPTPTGAAELAVPVLSEVIDAVEALRHRLTAAAVNRVRLLRSEFESLARHDWFRDPLRRLREYEQQLDEIRSRMTLAVRSRHAALARRLHRAELAVGRVRPDVVLARRWRRLDRTEARLRWAQRERTVAADRALTAVAEHLRRRSPMLRVERLRDAVGHLERRLRASSHEQVLARGFSVTRTAAGRIVASVGDVRTGDRLRTEVRDGEFDSRVLDARQGELFDADA